MVQHCYVFLVLYYLAIYDMMLSFLYHPVIWKYISVCKTELMSTCFNAGFGHSREREHLGRRERVLDRKGPEPGLERRH